MLGHVLAFGQDISLLGHVLAFGQDISLLGHVKKHHMLGHVLAFIGHKGIERYHMSHKSLLFWEFIVNVTLSGQRNNEYYSI